MLVSCHSTHMDDYRHHMINDQFKQVHWDQSMRTSHFSRSEYSVNRCTCSIQVSHKHKNHFIPSKGIGCNDSNKLNTSASKKCHDVKRIAFDMYFKLLVNKPRNLTCFSKRKIRLLTRFLEVPSHPTLVGVD